MLNKLVNDFKESGKGMTIDGWFSCLELLEKCFEACGKELKLSDDIIVDRESMTEPMQTELIDGNYLYNFRGYGIQVGGKDGDGSYCDNYNHLLTKCRHKINLESFRVIYDLTLRSVLERTLRGSKIMYFSKNDNEVLDILFNEFINNYSFTPARNCTESIGNILGDFMDACIYESEEGYSKASFSGLFNRISEEDKKLLDVTPEIDGNLNIVLKSDVLTVKFPYWCGCMSIHDLSYFVNKAFELVK